MFDDIKIEREFINSEFSDDSCAEFANYIANNVEFFYHRITRTEAFEALIYVALACLEDGVADNNYAMESFNDAHMRRFFTKEEIARINLTLSANGKLN